MKAFSEWAERAAKILQSWEEYADQTLTQVGASFRSSPHDRDDRTQVRLLVVPLQWRLMQIG